MNIEENSDIKKIFKLREVDDYSGYIEGDYEASLGKIITTLIIVDESFIVYLDQDNYVEWSYNDKYEESESLFKNFGLVLNKIGLLEELSKNKLQGEKLKAFRRLLGESLGRILDNGDEENALLILNQAQQLLNEKNSRILILSAFKAVSVVIAFQFSLWLNKHWFHFLEIPNIIYSIIISSLAGGIGAFLFLMIRSKSLDIEPTIDEQTYKWEGILRIIYGVLIGLIFYLAVTTKFIFGNFPQTPDFILFICLLSGASEKALPSIIKKIDDQL